MLGGRLHRWRENWGSEGLEAGPGGAGWVERRRRRRTEWRSKRSSGPRAPGIGFPWCGIGFIPFTLSLVCLWCVIFFRRAGGGRVSCHRSRSRVLPHRGRMADRIKIKLCAAIVYIGSMRVWLNKKNTHPTPLARATNADDPLCRVVADVSGNRLSCGPYDLPARWMSVEPLAIPSGTR